MNDFAEFLKWANAEGYDTAHTYDTDRSVWIFLNPMTADLRKAWQASRSHPAALAVHEVVGWRLVPVIPTEVMICTGARTQTMGPPGNKYTIQALDIYRAMLDAAPSPDIEGKK